MQEEIIQKSGAWFSYQDARIGQGRDNARKFLEDNPDVAKEIEDMIRQKAQSAMSPVTALDEDDIPEMPEDLDDEE